MRGLCLQRTLITAQTAIMMAPLAGNHDSNTDELGTQLVHVVVAEKSYAKGFEIECTNLEPLSCPRHEHRETTSMWFTML